MTESLTDQYYRARRTLVLISGLLFAWAYVGLRVGVVDNDAPGIRISELSDIKITIASPEAAPMVLAILVLYFIYRIQMEWILCSSNMKLRRASKVDISVSTLLGILALGVYASQSITEIRIADIITPKVLSIILIGTISGTLASIATMPTLYKRSVKYKYFEGRKGARIFRPSKWDLLENIETAGLFGLGTSIIALVIYRPTNISIIYSISHILSFLMSSRIIWLIGYKERIHS